MAASRLDLPLPFAPTMPSLCPACTVRLAPSRSRLAPRASVTRSMRITLRSGAGGSRRIAVGGRSSDVASPKISAQLEVVVDDQRRMIGEAAGFVDRRRARGCGDARRRDLVVDAPADILGPRLPAIGPPGILFGPRIEATEDIDEAQLVEHLREPRALLGQEARVLLVAAPVLEDRSAGARCSSRRRGSPRGRPSSAVRAAAGTRRGSGTSTPGGAGRSNPKAGKGSRSKRRGSRPAGSGLRCRTRRGRSRCAPAPPLSNTARPRCSPCVPPDETPRGRGAARASAFGTSAGWHLISCTQRTSHGELCASQRAKPLRSAERSPLTLSVMMRIG